MSIALKNPPDLSRMTGTSRHAVFDWQRRGTNPGVDRIIVICEAFKITSALILHRPAEGPVRLPRPMHLSLLAKLKEGKAKRTEDYGAYKVYKQILHGIQNSYIQISALNGDRLPGRFIDYSLCYIINPESLLSSGGIQFTGLKMIYYKIFLHIRMKENISAAFKELPENAYGHRKTK